MARIVVSDNLLVLRYKKVIDGKRQDLPPSHSEGLDIDVGR